MRFGHPGLQYLVKIVPGLGIFNKISIKELHKRFESVNFHKGLRTKIGQQQSSTSVKRTVFWIGVVNNPFYCIIVRENSWFCSNHVDAKIPNSLINELVILKV